VAAALVKITAFLGHHVAPFGRFKSQSQFQIIFWAIAVSRRIQMPDVSAILSLPYIQPNQAQKHVTHNEGIRMLDALVQPAVLETTLNTPPAGPVSGDRYIVAAGALADWAGHENALAVWDENYWRFYAAQTGWMVWDQAAGNHRLFDGTEWVIVNQTPDQVPLLGVNTSADATNRLAVASDATLLTHNGGGHQLKLNKAAAGDTASLLFQTGWTGHAEMGTAGSNDFAIKTSADGGTFHTALVADAATGEVSFPSGVTGLTQPEFGAGGLVTTTYSASKGLDLVTNGTGLLGNSYNMPSNFTFEPVITPNLPGAFSYAGYFSTVEKTQEFLPVDPNKMYRLGCYARQASVAGDWSAFANQERHSHYMGLMAFDADKTEIAASQHMRYYSGGVDSLTTLSAPLTPGDTSVQLVNAAGWNDASTATYHRGIIIFGYKNSFGGGYDYYSRHVQFDMFATSGVDKTNHVINLTAPFPVSLGNPDDPNGTWPVGTRLANSSSGGNFKYSFFSGMILPQTDAWYRVENHMGGIDTSGTNATANFPPGTAYVKVFWLPNYSNRAGGYSTFPDTGTGHEILFSGISVGPEQLGAMQENANGSVSLKVPSSNFAAGTVGLAPQTLKLTAL